MTVLRPGHAKAVILAILATGFCARIEAQQVDYPAGVSATNESLAKAMPDLAERVLPLYKESDRVVYLSNLFKLELVAGRYEEALRDIRLLHDLRVNDDPHSKWIDVQFDVYATAKARQQRDRTQFEAAYRQSFREMFWKLDDQTAAVVVRSMSVASQFFFDQALHGDLDRQKGKATILLSEAVNLLRDYAFAETYRAFTPVSKALIEEDDRRRYVIYKDLGIKTSDGATICTNVVLPKAAAKKRVPALFNFTIYAEVNANVSDARMAAAHGYAGVSGLTRGKGTSPDAPVPYEHDGSDADAVIDWIASQPWSDGRVGMFGGSYEGFTTWAAAKHKPRALKAIMAGAPAAPNIDVPCEGNICWNFIYPWPFYTLDNKGLDDETYGDSARWSRINRDYYVSGRAYHDLDKIDGTSNPIFDRWIAHPDYDSYWQSMIPYREEFAQIDIPVLQTAGYFFGGPGAALYYFTQHCKYNPHAEDYLLIGPYSHTVGQHGTIGLLGGRTRDLAGYALDPVAQIDIWTVLRYQWFDYVFKGAPKPELLKDKVNYEVTGANVWKHAATLAAMSKERLRFHLTAARSGEAYRLDPQRPPSGDYVPLTVDLADRKDVDRDAPGGALLDKAIDPHNGVEFVSDPLQSPELSGLFSGHLEFICNKKDFDFQVTLYELTPQGDYLQLPPYWSRASYVGDITHRRLLTPGKRESLEFQSVRLMSRQFEPGSKLVVVLSVVKEPGRQINYGTGKDVSEETIADAGEPLSIRLFGDSYVEVPVCSRPLAGGRDKSSIMVPKACLLGQKIAMAELFAAVGCTPTLALARAQERQALSAGFTSERTLGPTDSHAYTVTLAEGAAIVGEADQHGVDLVIDEFDPDGKLITTVDSPNGTEGPEPIDLTAFKAGQYRLVIRPADKDAKPGKYVMKIDRIVSPGENGKRLAEKNFPPVMFKLWQEYQTDPKAVEKLLDSRQGKGPIVEPIPGDSKNLHVTYLYHGDENTKAVRTGGGPHWALEGILMLRFLRTPLFYGEEDVPNDARYSYGFAEIKERFVGPGGMVQVLEERFGVDPLNPVQKDGLSVLTMPVAAPQPYIVANPSTPKGKLTPASLKSAALNEDRTFTVYTPPGYDGAKACDLLIVFDGPTYGGGTPAQISVPTPTILDNLIAANKIRPTIALLVNNMGHRNRDLFCYRPFADFIATELVPWARKNYEIEAGAKHVVAAGSSAGGLASSYVAFTHSDVIGNVLSQSGSYWQRKDWQKPALPRPVSEDSGDLLLDFKKSRRLPIRFYLEIGRFDSLGQMLGTNRELRDVLELKGYSLIYREFDSGHDYIWWRG